MAQFCERGVAADGTENGTITNIGPIFNVDRVIKHGICQLLEGIAISPNKQPINTEVIYLLLDDSFVFFTKDQDNVSQDCDVIIV